MLHYLEGFIDAGTAGRLLAEHLLRVFPHETVARFEGGNPFTLEPEKRADGWTGAFRLTGGQGGTIIGAEVRAEEQPGHTSVSGRVSIGIRF